MSKYRLTYCEGEEVRFISHLDFLRTMVRTFKRAKLPVKYSEGFNPHMVMSIGLPLSVGTTTVCDILEIELTEDVDTNEAMQKINLCTPRDIRITKMEKADILKPMHTIESALYTAEFETDKDIDISEYISAPCVMIEKKSKRKINEVNIKDFIRKIDVVSTDGRCHKINMVLNAGNTSNLKPELVLGSMNKFFGTEISYVRIERKEIYFED